MAKEQKNCQQVVNFRIANMAMVLQTLFTVLFSVSGIAVAILQSTI